MNKGELRLNLLCRIRSAGFHASNLLIKSFKMHIIFEGQISEIPFMQSILPSKCNYKSKGNVKALKISVARAFAPGVDQ
jgi:hypothetical protein